MKMKTKKVNYRTFHSISFFKIKQGCPPLVPDSPAKCNTSPVLGAPLAYRALLADLAFASVFPVPFPVGGSIVQSLVSQAENTIVVFIVAYHSRILFSSLTACRKGAMRFFRCRISACKSKRFASCIGTTAATSRPAPAMLPSKSPNSKGSLLRPPSLNGIAAGGP